MLYQSSEVGGAMRNETQIEEGKGDQNLLWPTKQ